jgi:hypothetical protein
MKKISTKQLEAVLQVIYSTNIPASSFDAIKKMFTELETIQDENTTTENPKE